MKITTPVSNATQLCGLVTFACKARGKGLILSWIPCGPSPSPCPLPEGKGENSASFWRHLMAPAGGAAPRSRNLFGGEDCLSEASSAALNFGTGAKAPGGPRPGANGFGSFCRNKRTSPCGADTPQDPPLGVRGRNPASRIRILTNEKMKDPGSSIKNVEDDRRKKNAPASGATSWRLRAGLCPGPETCLGARTV